MKIFGYSDRGIINTLFYEIGFNKNSKQILLDIFKHSNFPNSQLPWKIMNCQIMIEQSFSDFGDADILALISEDLSNKYSVFIEAKTKPRHSKWQIEKEFEQFTDCLDKKVPSSNLFAQIYNKLRLVKALKENPKDFWEKGIVFPKWSSKPVRKIGKDAIIWKAAELLSNFIDQTYYLFLVPDSFENVESFFSQKLSDLSLKNKIPYWNIKNFGFLTWQEVQAICYKWNLKNTIEVIKFNNCQIF